MKAKEYRKKPVVIEAVQWTGENMGEILGFFGGAARGVEILALADEAFCWVNNPSAWDNYDDGASEVIRRLVEALRAIAEGK